MNPLFAPDVSGKMFVLMGVIAAVVLFLGRGAHDSAIRSQNHGGNGCGGAVVIILLIIAVLFGSAVLKGGA